MTANLDTVPAGDDEPGGMLFGPDIFGKPAQSALAGKLGKRFAVPPFGVLDARAGYWSERKQAWLGLGLKSEVGRDAKAYNIGDGYTFADGHTLKANKTLTSVFDPVLCELVYRWFVPPNGTVLDPFAGGSVRGVVASFIGHRYTGVDIRPEQVAANREQADVIGCEVWRGGVPEWVEGNSSFLTDAMAGRPPFDAVFTCPPYYDLETYGGPDGDGSMLPDYDAFLDWYAGVFAQCAELLAADRFMSVVVGEIRDDHGTLRNFVGDTISVLRACGLSYFNDAMLVTMVGTAAVRAEQFRKNRKLVRGHQWLLVFYKGNPQDVAKRWPELTDVVDGGG